MRSGLILLGILLAATGCNAAPPEPVVTQATMTVSPADPACRDYTMQAIIEGKPQSVTGHACQQPDGSWRVVEGVAGQPQQPVQVYPAPYSAYVYDPWLWGPPIGFSIGAVVFVHRGHGHHFHAFRPVHGFGFHAPGFAFHHHAGFTHGGFHHHGT